MFYISMQTPTHKIYIDDIYLANIILKFHGIDLITLVENKKTVILKSRNPNYVEFLYL